MTVKRCNKLVGTGLRIDYKQSLFQKSFRNNFPNLSRVSIVALLSFLLPSAAYIENWLAHSLEYVYNQDRDMNITIWSGLIEWILNSQGNCLNYLLFTYYNGYYNCEKENITKIMVLMIFIFQIAGMAKLTGCWWS